MRRKFVFSMLVLLLAASAFASLTAYAQTLKSPVKAVAPKAKTLVGNSANAGGGTLIVYGTANDPNTQRAMSFLADYAGKLNSAGANVQINLSDVPANDGSFQAKAQQRGWGILNISGGQDNSLQANLRAVGLNEQQASDPVIFAVNRSGMIEFYSTGALTENSKDMLVDAALRVAGSADIQLNESQTTIKKGATFSLRPTVMPKISAKYVKYQSSDTSIARVTQAGKVKGVGYGTTTVTASFGNQTAVCKVTVTAPLKSFKLSAKTLDLDVGDKFDLTIGSFDPFNAVVDVDSAQWSSSNPKVAMVSGGKVTAIGAGKSTITAKLSGKSASCSLTVTGSSGASGSNANTETSSGSGSSNAEVGMVTIAGGNTAGAPAGSSPPAGNGPASGALEDQVLRLVNQERAKRGLSQLVYYAPLESASRVRAEEITRSFSHTRPDGSSCFTAVGFKMNWGGENIAMGYDTAEQVMEGWMNSPSHRENILNANYREMGLGTYRKDGKTYWVQMFSAKK